LLILPSEQGVYMETTYVSVTNTARLVRNALRQAFPELPRHFFSVRSASRSIDIGWVDGPTEKAVKAIVDRYQGCDFDGMQDMKVQRPVAAIEQGRAVHYCADYILCDRRISHRLLTAVVVAYCEFCGYTMPPILGEEANAYIDAFYKPAGYSRPMADELMPLVHSVAADEVEGLKIGIVNGRIDIIRK
jgi:hypothetical protein